MRLWAAAFLLVSVAFAQNGKDVIGVHDLSPAGASPVKGGLGGSCLYCHAPHNGVGGSTPLWNQKLSTQTYSTYTSSTYKEKSVAKPATGSTSLLCLSCHDGSVAPGQTQAFGKIATSGHMKPDDVFTSGLQNSHPNNMVLPLKDAPDLFSSVASSGKTLDPAGKVKLIKGNVECTTCHDPHVQNNDSVSQKFLVRDSSSGQLCLACHDPNRLMNGQPNRLAQWTTSAHATASNTARGTVAPVGDYHVVAQNACASCHKMHNAPGAAGLLRAPNEQDCLLCHGGGSNITPAAPNVFAEFAKSGHPFPTDSNQHQAGESALINQNRHATCVDCHNPHSSTRVTAFTAAPGVRASQANVMGVSAADGVSAMKPAAINQYENCLRCHGTSTGKASNRVFGYLPVWTVSAGDPLNIIPQFAQMSSSSHPVMHDRSSILPQPSLRSYMMNLDGATPGRSMGVRLLCTDCHNSDDNRESGGAGPNGPHGSKFAHILERRYEFSQATHPGQTIMNLFPNPDLGATGPYALCAKCHDLKQVMTNSSFNGHAMHINSGFSCSTCHTAHGMGNVSASISGERLVNFDANVVASNGRTPVSYNRATNSCNLSCHGHAHQGLGGTGIVSTSKAGHGHR